MDWRVFLEQAPSGGMTYLDWLMSGLLWTLLVVPFALGCYAVFERSRRSVAARFASTQMQPNVVERPARRRRHVPTACYAVALAALGLATARPYVEVVERVPSTTVVLAIDTSDSMRATDEPPTRLRAAQNAAAVFLRTVPPDVRVGVVGFSDRVKVVIPPTVDRQATLQAMQSMRTRSGTAIGAGVAAALRQVAGAGGTGVIVLLSDGANNAGVVDPVRAAREAGAAGVPVSTVAIGASQRPAGGFSVPARAANVELLGKIALLSGGSAYSVRSAGELQDVYRRLGGTVTVRRYLVEITWMFVLVGVALAALGGALARIWLRRIP